MPKQLIRSTSLFLLFICVSGYSQLSSPYANYSDISGYTVSGLNDSLYFYLADNDSAFIFADTTLLPGSTIEWSEYIPAIGYQSIAFTGTKLAVDVDTLGKSYQLTLRSAVDTIVQRCWVFQNEFKITVSPKDNEQQLGTGAYIGCDLIEPIWVAIDSSEISYFNPESHQELTYRMNYTLSWKKELEVEEGKITAGKIPINGLLKSRITSPYWKDMWYTAIVKDASGQEGRDSVFVRSITPKADFTVEYIELENKDYYTDKDSSYYYFYGTTYRGKEIKSAPALFFFKNSSENADSYLWNFDDSLKLETDIDSIIHEYKFWGNFQPHLTARHKVEWSLLVCEDFMEAEDEIKILEPKLKADNAISIPDGDNNVFRFADITIVDFEISIFNRSGMRVHHFKGNIRDWDGWDGRNDNSTNYVPTGVYYYIVKNYSVILPFDPKAERGATWSSGSDDGSTGSTGTGGTQTSTGSSDKKEKTNTQFRGFFHVFNTE